MNGDHARVYSSLGWALLPLNGKNPIGHGWERTQPLPPAEAGKIWATRDCNMGLVLGPSGVIDYEMDAGSEDEYLALVGGSVPDTPAYRTGAGKLHILFRDPGGLSRRTRNGLELRAGNHQSVIPPSLHPETGKPYEWVNQPVTPLLDLPGSLLEFFSTASNGPSESHWRKPLRSGRKLGEGEGRHASLISFLGKAVNVFDTPEHLVSAALFYSQETHDPPYPDDVVEQQALDVWHRYREEPEPAEADNYLGIKTLDKIVMRSVQFVWKPFLQRSAFHLLVGRKGAGKGSLLAYIAAQETNGQLEGESESRAVLWISSEDSFGIDVKPRIVAQGGDPRMVLTVDKRIKLPEDLPHIEAVCREHNVGMLVIDPIAGAVGAIDSNAEGPIVTAIGGLNELADRLDLIVVGVRHLGKNIDRGALEAVLGNVAWVNTPRVILGIAQDVEEKVVTLQVLAGNRSRSMASYDFDLNEELVPGLREPVSKVVPRGESDTDLSDVLAKQPRGKKYEAVRAIVLESIEDGTPASKEGILTRVVQEAGSSMSTVTRVLKDLKEEGVIKWIVPPKNDRGQVIEGGKWYFEGVRP